MGLPYHSCQLMPAGLRGAEKSPSDLQPPIQSPTPDLQSPTFKPRQHAGGFLALGNWKLESSACVSAALPIAANKVPAAAMSDNPLMSVTEHRTHAPASVRCAVITISDTRTEETDTSGRAVSDLLAAEGHTVMYRTIVRDDADRLSAVLEEALAREDVDVVLGTGGTGITTRDGTYEVVSALIEKRLDGFGELFRMLSYTEIGSAAMLSRACAGLARGKIIVAMPGSEAAVRLAMRKLLLPELGHMVREARR